MKRRLLVILAAVASLAVARRADACSCFGWTDVDGMARRTPVVLVGRITATGDPRYAGPRWADFQVESVAKGSVSAATVRIWDPWAASDCGGALDTPAPGDLAVVALRPVSAATTQTRELWALLEFPPPPAADFVIADEACAEPLKVLKTPRDQRRWLRRRLK